MRCFLFISFVFCTFRLIYGVVCGCFVHFSALSVFTAPHSPLVLSSSLSPVLDEIQSSIAILFRAICGARSFVWAISHNNCTDVHLFFLYKLRNRSRSADQAFAFCTCCCCVSKHTSFFRIPVYARLFAMNRTHRSLYAVSLSLSHSLSLIRSIRSFHGARIFDYTEQLQYFSDVCICICCRHSTLSLNACASALCVSVFFFCFCCSLLSCSVGRSVYLGDRCKAIYTNRALNECIIGDSVLCRYVFWLYSCDFWTYYYT